MFKKICNVLSTIIMILLIALAGIIFVPRLMGYSEYAVLSGSMVPNIPVGALVFDKKPEGVEFEKDMVVTYQLSGDTLVTHRITAVDADAKTLTTKGDANNVEDGAPVAFSAVVGVYAFHVPYLGFISIYSKTPIGIAVVCGVLIVIILLNFLPDALSPEEKKDEDKEKDSKEA